DRAGLEFGSGGEALDADVGGEGVAGGPDDEGRAAAVPVVAAPVGVLAAPVDRDPGVRREVLRLAHPDGDVFRHVIVLPDVRGQPGPAPRVQLVSGAAGRVHVAVPELGQVPPGPADGLVVQPPDGPLRGRGGVAVAADHAHPDAGGVVVGGVRSDDQPSAALVDPAADVDQEVVADVRPAPAVHVEVLDAPDRLGRGAFGVVHDELAALRPAHRAARSGCPGAPFRPADDVHGPPPGGRCGGRAYGCPAL